MLLFSFIRYTQPGWYFNLISKSEKAFPTCYYHPELLPLPGFAKIEADQSYKTIAATYADIGYRAWHSGVFLETTKEVIEEIKKIGKPSLKDEYRFLIKYWGRSWAAFALLIRLVTFKNPFKEISAFIANGKTKKVPLHDQSILYPFHPFVSALVEEQPLISVIIPTLNRYEYLKDALSDLEKQNYKNFDVIIIDQSEAFNADFYKAFNLNLKVIEQKEKLLWTARNTAVKQSKADYLLFFDDDSRVEYNWIEAHLKSLDYFKTDISAGVSISVVGGKVSKSYNFFRWADQFDSGNALVRRSVFEKIGLFDLQFNKQSMGDSEFGLRAYLSGIKSVSNPVAKRVHLKVSSGGLREIGHWDGFRPKKLFAPKPVPSVIYLLKKYYPHKLYRNSVYLGILISNVSYKNKRSSKAVLSSAIVTFFKLPFLIIQIRKSLKQANAKLAEGDKIEWLH